MPTTRNAVLTLSSFVLLVGCAPSDKPPAYIAQRVQVLDNAKTVNATVSKDTEALNTAIEADTK